MIEKLFSLYDTLTYLSPVHFVSDGCDAGAHSNGGGVGCIPDLCNSTLSRSTGRAGTLLTHARCTLSQNNSTNTATCIAVTSHYLPKLRHGVVTHGSFPPGTAPFGLPLTAPNTYRCITCTCLCL